VELSNLVDSPCDANLFSTSSSLWDDFWAACFLSTANLETLECAIVQIAREDPQKMKKEEEERFQMRIEFFFLFFIFGENELFSFVANEKKNCSLILIEQNLERGNQTPEKKIRISISLSQYFPTFSYRRGSYTMDS